MNKFCANCGAELNDKSKCDKCGKVSGETAVNNLVDKVKNYDYKGKAEEMKEKASDIADKAKSYDYKSKAEEVKETVTNYDYKGEAENIKKGGFKYFWSKHTKLSIAIMCVIIIGIVGFFVGNSDNNISNNSSDAMFMRDDDLAVDMAIDRTYKAVGGKDPQFVSADVIERNKNNEYLIEVIWKEDTAYRYTTNFVVYIGIKKKLSDTKWDYNYNYLFTQSENYLEDLVPKLKSKVEWDNQ
ncbi:MAG: hypothetical protein PUF08_02185 [Clostridiales bacterium]|nr:hypothetical protein [Clostridiales bacterium]